MGFLYSLSVSGWWLARIRAQPLLDGLCVALAQPLVATLGVALVGAAPAPSVCKGTQRELWNCLTLERLVLWLFFFFLLTNAQGKDRHVIQVFWHFRS